MVFGPVMAMLAACITDVLGYVIRSGGGMYFLPFILTEVGGALVFALFLYRAKGHHHPGHAQPVLPSVWSSMCCSRPLS